MTFPWNHGTSKGGNNQQSTATAQSVQALGGQTVHSVPEPDVGLLLLFFLGMVWLCNRLQRRKARH